jgi:uncharacterized coiled-coil protein SlyX
MLDRKPPAEVRRILRTEVGFGCPVPECRKPFLTWHHFDPPWHEWQHHDPAGMIALCREHHDAADRGLFSKGDLQALKKAALSVEDVKARFPWAKRGILVRLGGVYCGGSSIIFAVSNAPIIRFTKDDSGLLLLSFELRSADSTPALLMEENVFLADPDALHDLEVDTGPTRIKAWFAKRDIGLDLSFRRVRMEELNEALTEDRQRAENIQAKLTHLLTPEMQVLIEQNSGRPPSWATGLPEGIREAHLSGDPVGWSVRHWATTNCLDDEQRIPFLDFRNMVVHDGGRRVLIRNGIRQGEGGIVYCTSFDNGSGAFNL